MNLMEVQQSLNGLPDEALIKEMQQPSGIAPQYMVLSELQRRKQMRAGAVKAPTTTVRQDVAGFSAGGGIRGFAEGKSTGGKSYEEMLIERERDKKKADPYQSLNEDSRAMGAFQIMPKTWNDTAKKYPKMGFKPVPLRPSEKEIPSMAEQRRMYPLLQEEFKDSLVRKGYNPNPANMYVAHWQGTDAGPKLLDYLSAHPMATAEDAFRYARPDAYNIVMSQNKINPKSFLSDVFGKVERDFGNFSVGEKMDDKGVIVPTRRGFDADLKRTINAPEDPDYLAWKAEQQASAPQLNSVPRQSAWNGILPEQEYQRPLRPNLGEPMNASGITELLQKLTPPTQMPGSKEPAPWQVIQQQGIRKFSGEGSSYVAPFSYEAMQKRHRDAVNRSRVSAGLPPLTDDQFPQNTSVSKESWGAVQDFTDQGPWADRFGLDNPEEAPLHTIARGISTVPALVASGLAATTGGAADAWHGIAGIPSWLVKPHGLPAKAIAAKAVRPSTSPSGGIRSAPPRSAMPGDQGNASAQPPNGPGSGVGEFDTTRSFFGKRDALGNPRVEGGIPSAVQDKERDKWMALAEFGSRLAAGNSPYFAQNFGPAASAGISSYRQSQSQYDDDTMKQAELRLRQSQIEEQANSRRDTTAAALTGTEGSIAEARIRANAKDAATALRGSAKDAGISDRDFASLIGQARELAVAASGGVPPTKEIIYAILSDLISKRSPYGVVGAGGVAGGARNDQGLNLDEDGNYR